MDKLNKQVTKEMKKYFDITAKYSMTINETYNNLVSLWKDNLINVPNEIVFGENDEDWETPAFLMPDDTDGECFFPTKLVYDKNDDDVVLYVDGGCFGIEEDGYLPTREWIDNDELVSFLIEQIAEHLGYDVGENALFIARGW